MSLATRFSKNLSFVVWARIVSVAASLTFLGISARVYGVAEFGQLVFVLATTSFLELTFCGSADSILVREQVRTPGDREGNLRACAVLHAGFALIVIAVSFSIAVYFRHDWNVSRGLVLAGIASAFQILFCIPVAHFRSEQNMLFESLLITIERFLFLSGFLAVVVTKAPMVLVFACLMISTAAKTMMAYAWLFRCVPMRVVWPARAKLGYFWRESLPLMGVTLLLSMHWRLDLFLMKAFSSAEQLGVYAASFRTMEMLRIVPTDVITSAFPIFCAAAIRHDNNDQLSRAYRGLLELALCGSMLVAIVGVLFAPAATRLLFGGAFANAVLPLRILIVSFPFIFWNQINSITLTSTNRQRWMLMSLVGALGCQLLVDVVLIPRRGAAGAGSGFALGETALLVGTLFAAAPLAINLRHSMGTFLRVVGAALCLCLLIALLHRNFPILTSVLVLPAYAVLLVLFNVVTRDDISIVKISLGRFVRSRAQVGPLVIRPTSAVLQHDVSGKS